MPSVGEIWRVTEYNRVPKRSCGHTCIQLTHSTVPNRWILLKKSSVGEVTASSSNLLQHSSSFLLESQVRTSDLHYPVPTDWLFPLQLSIWHSSRLLTGLLDFKVSHSVIHLLHRNKLLFSSCCFLPCVMGQQSWILVGSLLWEKLCLCSQTPLSTWLSWQALTQWCFTKRCT